MTSESELTIPEAAKAYGINLNTLHSWKREEKIRTRAEFNGKKKSILVDIPSLEAHLATQDPISNSKTESKIESEKPQSSGMEPAPDSNTPSDNGELLPPKSEKKGRKKPRVKSPLQNAKNSMRSFSNTDLLNIQHWITQRLESRLNDASETAVT